MQRYRSICDHEYYHTTHLAPEPEGDVVLYADALERERVLREALEESRHLVQMLLNTSIVAKSSGNGGHDGNGNCWAEIANTRMPDWAAKQLLGRIDAALAQ